VLRADGAVDPVGGRGTLLGVVEAPELAEASIFLGPGDVIAFYTDGLTESRRGGELLGEARVRALLAGMAGTSAAGVADALEKASETFGDRGRRDDLAVLVLKVPAA
jgi:serine phosphatase RsbU (regulator of sigma subunit)